MICRGVRGAVTVEENRPDLILGATRRLLEELVGANGVSMDDVASAIFTTTADLDVVHPARAAREMGWVNTPLLCMQEMAVKGSLPRCIRVLIHWNTDRSPAEIKHIYLGEARQLRPDLVKEVHT